MSKSDILLNYYLVLSSYSDVSYHQTCVDFCLVFVEIFVNNL